jgi:ATP-dependent DNA ligase
MVATAAIKYAAAIDDRELEAVLRPSSKTRYREWRTAVLPYQKEKPAAGMQKPNAGSIDRAIASTSVVVADRFYRAPIQETQPLEFVVPSAPVLAKKPPTGDEWAHEVKFDGCRAQFHKKWDHVVIYRRKGRDLTRSFPQLCRASLVSRFGPPFRQRPPSLCCKSTEKEVSPAVQRSRGSYRYFMYS